MTATRHMWYACHYIHPASTMYTISSCTINNQNKPPDKFSDIFYNVELESSANSAVHFL